MKPSTRDADLYLRLMWSLLSFVDRERGLGVDLGADGDPGAAPLQKKMQLREALLEHRELIDAFVERNPDGLPDDQLAIVSKWRHLVVGRFYVERILKKHAIFVSADDNRVFGVIGLNDTFEDIFYGYPLPVLVRAVLLPFKGAIIYDGILQSYSVTFGGGYKASLKETYMAAKQNGRLILTLDPDAPPSGKAGKPRKPPRDWRPELDDLIERAGKLRAGSGQHALMKPAFRLLRLTLELARAAAEDPHDLDRLWKAYGKLERAGRRIEDVLHRSEM